MVKTMFKVVAYITRANELLVFKHAHFPEVDIQVPAGTVKPGEAPKDAVMRECAEETGLADFMPPEYLIKHEFNAEYSGKSVSVRRLFYHIVC